MTIEFTILIAKVNLFCIYKNVEFVIRTSSPGCLGFAYLSSSYYTWSETVIMCVCVCVCVCV
jgi:hypothetical protein